MHKHRMKTEGEPRPFAGPVSIDRENRAAHGNICVVVTCSCGARQRRNINGRHVEYSEWTHQDEAGR